MSKYVIAEVESIKCPYCGKEGQKSNRKEVNVMSSKRDILRAKNLTELREAAGRPVNIISPAEVSMKSGITPLLDKRIEIGEQANDLVRKLLDILIEDSKE